MLTPSDFMAAIKAALKKTFPNDQAIYENLVERDMKRPSTMVELVTMQIMEIDTHTTRFLFRYKITNLINPDDYGDSDFAALDLRTLAIEGIFGAGYLKVGDRAPKVTSCTSEHNRDYTQVTVDFSVAFDRAEFEPAEILPLMQQLDLKTKTKEDTTL